MSVKLWLMGRLPPRRLSSGVCGLLVACVLLGPSALPAQEGPAKAEASSQPATLSPDWFGYKAEDGSFEVSMPVQPLVEKIGSAVKVTGNCRGGVTFFVVSLALSKAGGEWLSRSSELTEAEARSLIGGLPVAAISSRKIKFGKYSGVELNAKNIDATNTTAVLVAKQDIAYFVGVRYPKDGHQLSVEDRRRFLESFKLHQINAEEILLGGTLDDLIGISVRYWSARVAAGSGSAEAYAKFTSAVALSQEYVSSSESKLPSLESKIRDMFWSARESALASNDTTGVVVLQLYNGTMTSFFRNDFAHLSQAVRECVVFEQGARDPELKLLVLMAQRFAAGAVSDPGMLEIDIEIDKHLLSSWPASRFLPILRQKIWFEIGNLALFLGRKSLVNKAVSKLSAPDLLPAGRCGPGTPVLQYRLLKGHSLDMTEGPVAALLFLEKEIPREIRESDPDTQHVMARLWQRTGLLRQSLEFYKREFMGQSKLDGPPEKNNFRKFVDLDRVMRFPGPSAKVRAACDYAGALLAAGQEEQATRTLNEALQIARAHSLRSAERTALGLIASMYFAQGRNADSRLLWEKSLETLPDRSAADAIELRINIAMTYPTEKSLALLQALRHEIDSSSQKSERLLAVVDLYIGHTLAEGNYYELAIPAIESACALAENIETEGRCHIVLCKLYTKIVRLSKAEYHARKALGIAEKFDQRSDLRILCASACSSYYAEASDFAGLQTQFQSVQEAMKSRLLDSAKGGGWRSYLAQYVFYADAANQAAVLGGSFNARMAYSYVFGLWSNDALRQRFQADSSKIKISQAHPTSALQGTLPQIQLALSKGKAVVQFVSAEDKAGCFVLTHDSIVFHRLSGSILKDLKKGLGADPEYLSRLYRELWTPLLTDLGQTKTVYIVATGGLCSVPFDALRAPSGRYLVEDYEIINLDHAAELLVPSSKVKLDNLTLVGGLNYSGSQQSKPPESTGSLSLDKLLTRSRSAEWVNLPGSEREVKLLAGVTRGKTLQDRQADKRSFKAALQTSSVVHISTHGYGSSESQSLDFSAAGANDPLLNSGLALSEANGSEEGCMTGFEISNMRLKNLKLVVLSTCRSSAGSTADGIGSVSLRRAFSVAGVRQTVASIWPVNDYHTPKLMKLFYEGLSRGESTSTALRNAKLATLRAGGESSDPAYWAGFVLYGK